MLKYFRAISIIEGLSYLAILSVTFGLISREFSFNLGMFHGILFMLYVALSLMVTLQKNGSILFWLALFLASLIPFAFIFVELTLRKKDIKPEISSA